MKGGSIVSSFHDKLKVIKQREMMSTGTQHPGSQLQKTSRGKGKKDEYATIHH